MTTGLHDVLSPLAREILSVAPATYGTLVAPGGTPAAAAKLLAGVRPDQLLAVPVVDPAAAYAMLAGLWLWHDGLHECHEIAQKSPADLRRAAATSRRAEPTPSRDVAPAQPGADDADVKHRHSHDMTETLAFWHAIMHRREGDFSNAKYWYARCRHHGVLREIPARAAAVLARTGNPPRLQALISGEELDPEGLVDVVEAVHRNPDDPLYPAAVKLQQVEWQALFDHCTRAAAGAS